MSKSIPTFLIICTSAAVGMLFIRGCQVQMNQNAKRECASNDYRRLVHFSTAIGDAYYCAPLAAFGK
jgi:hypothetical protein